MTLFQNLHRSLPFGQVLKIECEGCGRRSAWRRDQAIAKLGPDATPADIRRRLTCSVCRASGQAKVWI